MGGPYEKRLKGEIPMPKFACQCITWGPANNSENKELIFREVKQAGFAGLEMGARNLRPEFVDFYQEMLDKYEPELAALHCGGEFTSDAAIEKNYASLQEAKMCIRDSIITASDCEGAGEMFQVTTMDLNAIPKDGEGNVDYSQDFFGKQANLTVSGQLNVEPFALSMRSVYTFGPTFRAENSNTPRHAAEFWMIEPEIAFADLLSLIHICKGRWGSAGPPAAGWPSARPGCTARPPGTARYA